MTPRRVKAEATVRARSPRARSSRTTGGVGWGAALAAATATGVGVFLSYPNFLGIHVWPLQWVALIPTLWAQQGRSPRSIFWLWCWAGFVTNTGGFYWLDYLLQEFGHLPLIASIPVTGILTAYQGVVFGIAGVVADWFVRRAGVALWMALPLGFVVAETFVPLIFPWYMANGQYPFTWISQMLDVTGVSGLTFFIVWTNACLFVAARQWRAAQKRARGLLLALAASWAIALGYGAVRTAYVDAAMDSAPKIRVGMVEANVGIWEKEAKSLPRDLRAPTLLYNLVKHQRLSAQAVAQGAEFLVWPESSYIPLGEVAIKRSDLFGVAVAESGGLLEWRNREWSAPAGELEPGVRGKAFRAAYVREERDIWVVGDGGVVLRWNGRVWKAAGLDSPVGLTAVGGDPRSPRTWVGGEDGTLYVWDGQRWGLEARLAGGAVVALGWDPRTRAPWALTADGRPHAGSSQGTWGDAPGAPAGRWRALGFALDGFGVMVGDAGQVAMRAGGGWQISRIDGAGELRGVAIIGPDDVWVGGEAGLFTFDGRAWKREEQPLGKGIRGVAATEDGRVAVVGADGRLASREHGASWEVAKAPDMGPLRAIVGVGFVEEVAIPSDVAWFYRSRRPLPSGADARAVYEEERAVPWRERTALQRGFAAPVIFGAVLFEEPALGSGRRVYNSALLIDERGRVLGRYDKNYLLTFGEYIPFGDTFPILYEWIPEASHFTAGTTVEAFDWAAHRLGVMVCYEDILPRFTGRLADKGTHALINITNDAWFGKTAEPYLHLALALARTIENRQWMVRSTNTGVSAFVDANGRLVAQTSLDGEEFLVADVPLLDLASPYKTLGELFTLLVLASALALAAKGLRGSVFKRR